MEKLVRYRAEDDPGERALARGADDYHPRVALGREGEQCLNRSLRDEHGNGSHAIFTILATAGNAAIARTPVFRAMCGPCLFPVQFMGNW